MSGACTVPTPPAHAPDNAGKSPARRVTLNMTATTTPSPAPQDSLAVWLHELHSPMNSAEKCPSVCDLTGTVWPSGSTSSISEIQDGLEALHAKRQAAAPSSPSDFAEFCVQALCGLVSRLLQDRDMAKQSAQTSPQPWGSITAMPPATLLRARAASIASRRASVVPLPPRMRKASAVSEAVVRRLSCVTGQPQDAILELMPLVSAALEDETPSVRSNGGGNEARTTLSATVSDTFEDGTSEVNQYVMIDVLGKGAQGEVFLAMDTEKNEYRAVKVVPRPHTTTSRGTAVGRPLNVARQRQREQLEREVAIMKRCRHRNVVSLYEVIDDPEHQPKYLVMQYVEHGPIATVAEDGSVSKIIDPLQLARFARQLAAGLEYLHRRGIIHRDIKPENILLGTDEQVYLADFGTAEMLDPGNARVEGTRGTLAFVAPELLADGDAPNKPVVRSNASAVSLTRYPAYGQRASAANSGQSTPTATSLSPAPPSPPREARTSAARPLHGQPERVPDDAHPSDPESGVDDEMVVDGEAVDVWALGVTLYALLYGRLPFFGEAAPALFQSILGDTAPLPSSPRLKGSPRAFGTSTTAAEESRSGTLNDTKEFVASLSDGHLPTSAGGPSTREGTSTDVIPAAAEVPFSLAGHKSPQDAEDAADVWAETLEGMLEKDPAQRWSLRRVRESLAALDTSASQRVTGTTLGSAITLRRPSVFPVKE